MSVVTVTGDRTHIVYGRSGRDRHFNSCTVIIPNGWYFFKVTVTRCGVIRLGDFVRVTVTYHGRPLVKLIHFVLCCVSLDETQNIHWIQ